MQSLSHENYKSGLTFTAVSSKEYSEAFEINISTFNKRLPPLQAILCSGIHISPKEILSWQNVQYRVGKSFPR